MDTEFFCRKIRGLRFLCPGGRTPGKREKDRRGCVKIALRYHFIIPSAVEEPQKFANTCCEVVEEPQSVADTCWEVIEGPQKLANTCWEVVEGPQKLANTCWEVIEGPQRLGNTCWQIFFGGKW